MGTLLLFTLLALALAPAALAAPPGNDNIGSPFNVDLAGGEVTANTREALAETDEPLTEFGQGVCSGRKMVATTWYRILGNGGTVSVDTFNSNFDTVIAVYPAPTPTLANAVICNDDASGLQQSFVSFQSVAGKAYLIQVGGCRMCNTFDSGDLKMHVSATEQPATEPVVVPVPTPGPTPPAPKPIVVAPPDGDADGVPDSNDKCPALKPTRDENNDGCQDKPKRILSSLGFSVFDRPNRAPGIMLTRNQLTRVPQGAGIIARCSRCVRRSAGRKRIFRTRGFTARRGGILPVGFLNKIEIPRGRALVIVITKRGMLGRRITVTPVRGGDKYKRTLRCLEVGSTTRLVPCSSGS